MSCMAGPSGEEEEKRHIIGYNSYSDAASSNLATHLHSFGPPPGPEMYNMENIISAAAGYPPKTHQGHHQVVDQDAGTWKGFFTRPAGPSSSISHNKPTLNHHHHHHPFNYHHDLTELLDDDDVDDPSSLRSSCVFTCEGLERPSHGLSLSLSSSNPSSIGLQSFELRQQQQQQQDDFIRFGPSSSRSVTNNNNHNNIQQHIRQSRYLQPAQELLSEFCNLQNDDHHQQQHNTKMKGIHHDDQESEINAIKKQSLYSLDLVELQRRKNKLLHMLEEVDRRYKQYKTQMRGVAAGFEAVAGEGAAAGYSALASRAMSRHFRSLKDGIMTQVKATKKAMGEKDTGGAPGTAKGETPRLRLLDQTLRQQRALQQMTNMEIHPWRPQRGLPERSVSVLRAWLFEHFLHPYPSDVDKHILARQTGLSRSQVSNWFINARVRLWKPMVEEMYLEELKEEQPIGNEEEMSEGPQHPNHPREQKPTHEQLVRIDSECLSSIINHPADKNGDLGKNKAIHVDHAFGDSFGAMEFDFSSYGGDHHSGGGVSLTLGLHQHGGGGGGGGGGMNMNMPFSPAVAGQGSIFYHRDHHHNSHHHGIEDLQTVQYSLMEGEAQNLPYRNLMGAQLLHDLAG